MRSSASPTANKHFWNGKRVFLTGHTGFKGSWMSQWLCDMGAIVRGYALEPQRDQMPDGFSALFDELGLAGRLEHQIGDVRDLATLKAAMQAFSPEIVIHMAAQPLVRLSYREPVETYATNVMGTVHVLDACRTLKDLKTVLIVTSDKCYENREQIWGYRESDAMGGHDPYSNSKGCAELVASAYRNSFFNPADYDRHGVVVCSGRAGNVIGGGDWSGDRLIPDVVRAYWAGEDVVIRNPKATRPWQHVIDPLSGYLRVIEASYDNPQLAAGGWNFGPGDEMNLTVADVLGLLKPELGERFNWRIETVPGQLHEAHLLKLDCTKARVHLDWGTHFDAAKMAEMTAAWYSEADPARRKVLTAEQLAPLISA